MSEAYCARCLHYGYETWQVIVATVWCCIDERYPDNWRSLMAPWALEIIDNSMEFHGKTEADLIAALREIPSPDEEWETRVLSAPGAEIEEELRLGMDSHEDSPDPWQEQGGGAPSRHSLDGFSRGLRTGEEVLLAER